MPILPGFHFGKSELYQLYNPYWELLGIRIYPQLRTQLEVEKQYITGRLCEAEKEQGLLYELQNISILQALVKKNNLIPDNQESRKRALPPLSLPLCCKLKNKTKEIRLNREYNCSVLKKKNYDNIRIQWKYTKILLVIISTLLQFPY